MVRNQEPSVLDRVPPLAWKAMAAAVLAVASGGVGASLNETEVGKPPLTEERVKEITAEVVSDSIRPLREQVELLVCNLLAQQQASDKTPEGCVREYILRRSLP